MIHQGKFKPRNLQKYLGDPTNIIFRSSWELKLMMKCDKDPRIIKWASEEIAIPYRSPVDRRIHRYFPDFYIKSKSADGSIKEQIIEVKPKYQTQQPKKLKGRITKKKKSTYLYEIRTWGINQAKWEAAHYFCKKKGWVFKLMTEENLGMI